MNDYQQYFKWPDVDIAYFYVYFLVSMLIAGYLVINSKSRHKIELFFISFYFLTGNLNTLLTIKIPGFSLFEIQPLRFLFLLLFFLIVRKTLFFGEPLNLTTDKKIPWFMVALISYIILSVISVIYNGPEIGISTVMVSIYDAMAIVVLIFGLSFMREKVTYGIIGKSIILGAVASAIISIIQLLIDPYFLRIGDNRYAFGEFLRSNGIFQSEYYHAYFLIIAVPWTLTLIKNQWLKITLVSLFILGVLTTFHRMSWIILTLVLVIYLVFINKTTLPKLALIGLSGVVLLLSLSVLYYQDFMNSSLVKERLSNTIEGREGYYEFVLDNIDKRPLFGYGGYNREVYYSAMLELTKSRDRAVGITGGLHSGYFASLFLYGIPAFICFVLFVLLSVFYYARSFKEDIYFIIPFFVSLVYLFGNLTNTFIFLSYLSALFAIHIGIGVGIKKIRADSTP